MTRDERAELCRHIASSGGHATYQKLGSAHMRAIGTAGRKVTIERHGLSYWLGLVERKGWHGHRRSHLSRDLAAGKYLAESAPF